MDLLDQLAEAVARGDFEALPGAGRPLELDDDALVPEELRVAYRILKNAGYVPEEVRRAEERVADLAKVGKLHRCRLASQSGPQQGDYARRLGTHCRTS
jgi:hypothetical protein